MSKKVLMKGFTICTIALSFDVFAQDASYTNNLTHDWDGKRSQLQENGVQIIGNYMHELGYNVSGGYNTDKKLEYANEILLGADFDLQKIINIPNAHLKIILTNRNGQDITNTRIINPEGGQLTSVQEVWGRGSITRLAELSYRQTFMDNKLNLRVGRFGFGEFGEFSCEFQNLLFCGNSSGANTGSLIYNFPVSQWAIQAKYKLTDSLTAQTAIFEQNPTLQENDNAFKISTSGSKGIIIPLEFVYQDKEADSKLRLGGYFSTANADDVYKDIQGNPKARTHLSAKEHEQRYGFWAMYQRNIFNLYSDNARPLELFSQVHYNDKDTSYIGNSINIGLLGKGLFQQRPQDIFGIAIGRIGVNSDYKKNIELQNIIDNFSVPVQNYEISTELFYGVNLQNGIVIRPNIQYIKNPGGVKETEDAVVAGLKVSVAL